MQVSLNCNFAFLCMPKCASTSIVEAINDDCPIRLLGTPRIKHMNARFYKTLFLPMLAEMQPIHNIESFCVMRDPIEHLHSWYRYRSRNSLKNKKNPNHLNFTGDISFDEFVISFMQDNSPSYAKFSSQFDFIRLDDGSVGVDRIFSVESLHEVESFLSFKLNREIQFPKKNVSRRKEEIEIDDDILHRLKLFLHNDYVVYNFIEKNGCYIKDKHFSELHHSL